MSAPIRRWPFAPLEPLIDARYKDLPAGGNNRVTTIGVAGKAAHVLDLAASQIHLWRKEGLPDRAADRIAVRLGYHPVQIWPEWHGETA